MRERRHRTAQQLPQTDLTSTPNMFYLPRRCGALSGQHSLIVNAQSF